MVNKLISIALAEEGYLEKKSNADLDDKTKNAGNKNYTKYWRDIYPAFQAQPWCDCFVKWCFVKAFGEEKAKELLCTNTFSYACKTSADYFVKKGQFDKTPKVGSQIFFWNNDKTLYGHTGIVYKVDKKYVYTVEGNTSAGSGVVANGGGVACKKYALTNSRIAGYGHPKYNVTEKKEEPKKEPAKVEPKQPTLKRYQVVVARGINIRAAATKSSKIIGGLPYKTVFNVTEVVDLKTASENLWGYIPEKKGWCCINYAKKI